MAVTTLTLGAVSLGAPPGEFSGEPDPAEHIAGDPPQWSDDDDATYAFVGKVFEIGQPSAGMAHAQAEPVNGNLLGFTATVRVGAVPGFGSSDPAVYLQLRHVPTNGFADTEVAEFPADGAIHDLTLTGITYEDNNPAGWLAEGIFVTVFATTTLSRVYIYEVAVTVTTTDVEDVIRPATRMFPRDDALGLSSAPRLVPPPKARRVVGGYL